MHSNQGKLVKLGLDPNTIMDQIQAGQSLRQIASTIGVSNIALRAWLLREDSERYHDVITAALTTRVAEADEELDRAADQVSIARAREQARFSRMDLERRRPHLYGQRQQIQVQHKSIRDVSDADLARVIESVAIQIQDAEQQTSDADDAECGE